MNGEIERQRDILEDILRSSFRAEQRRAIRWESLWNDLVAAEPRLACMRDNPELRGEIEARASTWEAEVDGRIFVTDWSRAEVVALAERVVALRDELAEIAKEAGRLALASSEGKLEEATMSMWMAVISAFDGADKPLANAQAAAEQLINSPKKAGGRGAYTQNMRARPVEAFGRALVPLFRKAGLSLGGNGNKDNAFAVFLEITHRHIQGEAIPGAAALLAKLRKG